MTFEAKIPELEGDARLAKHHDGGHIQIIASAGSGKTETVSQRIARLVAEGCEPSEIVAFTFTTRAADELKGRIRDRVLSFAGEDTANKLGGMYVGTIHGYCFQLLSKHISQYEAYEVADENQFAAFLLRYANKLNIKAFGEGKLFAGITRFNENLQVFENEMLTLDQVPEDFASAVKSVYGLLDEHRLLTYGLQINKAVEMLEDEVSRAQIAATIKHLIVDEYQDVNPAQERLIQLLAKPHGGADLVVVGDDDQAIYQWRGSSLTNIITFAERYKGVQKFELLTNRRSRPAIVKLADKFAKSIPGRLEKTMLSARDANGPAFDAIHDYDDEETEAQDLALSIQELRNRGFSYNDMAVLVRTSTSYPAIMRAFESHHIPIQPGGRLGLFEMVDADFLGRVFAWLADHDWKKGRWTTVTEVVTLGNLRSLAATVYSLETPELDALEKQLSRSKALVGKDSRGISLVSICYEITACLGIKEWDSDDLVLASRLGTIARFTKFLADYEAMTRHARISTEEENRQIGMADQGSFYFTNLAILMLNLAQGNYKDFEGEDDLASDSVELMTIHSAKGLEWPIVFIPSLTVKRFPNNSKVGKANNWIISREKFDAGRYEGTDEDERRLFYVAITRAREWLSLSAHQRVTTQSVQPSPYIVEAINSANEEFDYPAVWVEEDKRSSEALLQITYSEIADYISCGKSYWLRNRIGFPPAIVEAIGYGNAVHHLMRAIAEETAKKGRQLTPIDVDRLLARDFFLPFAGRAISDNLRESARKLIFGYLKNHGEEMNRVWETERPFELSVPGAVISGRADVILDRHEGKPDNLAILDYKTSVGEQEFSLQLQIYAEAGIREGLEIRGAYVHDMGAADRKTVDTSVEARAEAVKTVVEAVEGIKARKFEANPHPMVCGRCDVRAICRSAKLK
jgi:DNA helicase-2/ATP-dependent DNA helicase PcrA